MNIIKRKEEYAAPEVTALECVVERGFADSIYDEDLPGIPGEDGGMW